MGIQEKEWRPCPDCGKEWYVTPRWEKCDDCKRRIRLKKKKERLDNDLDNVV